MVMTSRGQSEQVASLVAVTRIRKSHPEADGKTV